jgi:hypothetical protein
MQPNKLTAMMFAAGLSAGAFAGSEAFVETFADGMNQAGWSYFGDPNNEVEVIEDAGGNPAEFLHATCEGLNCLDTFAPRPRTEMGVESEFTGDYRERQVTAVGIDLILFYVDSTAAGRPLTVMLVSDNDTPGDPSDDLTVYKIGNENVPLVGQGWETYDFEIPSQSETLPEGWVNQMPSGEGDDADWNTVITDVDQLKYFYGDPELFFIFQQWEPGLDNPRIFTETEDLLGDLNDDGAVDVQDLLILLEAYGDCEEPCPPACLGDINEDCTVDVIDLLTLLQNWS